MGASSRRVVAALIVSLFGSSLRGQSAADTILPASSHATIDVASAVRERGDRSLSDVLTSRAPGLLVVPGSGVNGMGARIRLRGVQSLVADRAPLVLVDGMRVEAAEDAFSPASTLNNSVFGYGYQESLPPGPLRLDDLNPDDIESIDVLPGAASAAIKVFDDPARIHVTPDCGLRTRSWEVAFKKLRNMTAGVALARRAGRATSRAE